MALTRSYYPLESVSPDARQDSYPSDNHVRRFTDPRHKLRRASGHLRATRARNWIYEEVPRFLDASSSQFAARLREGIEQTEKHEPVIRDRASEDHQSQQELQFRLWNCDTLTASKITHSTYPDDKIAVLNMADPHIPGGSLLNGGVAQEEMLCAHTTLHQTLSASFYPLQIPDVIHSPDVLVCRMPGDEWPGVELANDDKFYIDVVSAAAVVSPKRYANDTSHQQHYYRAEDARIMQRGITNIIASAVEHGAQRLVLGAWGCYSSQNPIHEVATLMKRVILSENGKLPSHNWAKLGLREIIIAINENDLQGDVSIWDGFVSEFRTKTSTPEEFESFFTVEVSHTLNWPVESRP